MPSKRLVAATAVAVLLAGSSGCALPGTADRAEPPVPGPDGPGVPSSAAAGSETEAASSGGHAKEALDEGTVQAYMSALAANSDPDRMREGLNQAAEGSTAHAYLTHLASVYQAWYDGGEPADDADFRLTEQGADLCQDAHSSADPACGEFTEFTQENGQITGFLVDGHDPGPRLVLGDGAEDDSEGVHASLLTAYQSAADDILVVTVEFTTVDNADIDLFSATYRDDDEHRVERAVGRYELDAGSATHAVFYFPLAELDGKIHVGGCLEECSALVDLTLPVG